MAKKFELKFWHALAILGVIITGIIIYGVATGSVPGVPTPKAKYVTVYTSLDSLAFCIGKWIRIDSVVVGPSWCSPSVGDPGGDVLITAYKEGQAVQSVTKKSCCGGCEHNSCFPWGCGGVRSQTTLLCLEPGTYKIEAKWMDVKDEKSITVS